jgi:hypothetical protein
MGYTQCKGRNQATSFPVVLDDFVPADHLCSVVDAFVEMLVYWTLASSALMPLNGIFMPSL